MDGEPKCECPVGDCKFSFAQSSAGYGYLMAHMQAIHPNMASSTPATRTQPRIQRPTIDNDCTPAAWATFAYEWEDYAGEYNLPDASRTLQFMHCLSPDLKQKVHTHITDYKRQPFKELMAAIKALAIKPVAVGKRRREAHMATQKQGELFGAFATRVKGLVVDCEYVLNCPHSTPGADAWESSAPEICGKPDCKGVDFEDAVIRDILLAGIYDEDVRRQVLAEADVHRMPIQRIIDLVQRQESAREDALFKSAPEAAAVSQHKRNRRNGGQKKGEHQALNAGNTKGPKVRPREKTCECGEKYFDFAKRRNGEYNENAYVRCSECAAKEWRAKSRGQRRAAAIEDRESESNNEEVSSDEEVAVTAVYEVAATTFTSYIATALEEGTHPCLPIMAPSEDVGGHGRNCWAAPGLGKSRQGSPSRPTQDAISESRVRVRDAISLQHRPLHKQDSPLQDTVPSPSSRCHFLATPSSAQARLSSVRDHSREDQGPRRPESRQESGKTDVREDHS